MLPISKAIRRCRSRVARRMFVSGLQVAPELRPACRIHWGTQARTDIRLNLRESREACEFCMQGANMVSPAMPWRAEIHVSKRFFVANSVGSECVGVQDLASYSYYLSALVVNAPTPFPLHSACAFWTLASGLAWSLC